jgi:hypothetical protein
MTISELKALENKIQQEIEDYANKFNQNKEAILDGIVFEELYLKSKYKIMWLLKEPYGGGGFKLGTGLVNEKDRIRDAKIPSLQGMTYVTYAILNNKHFHEMNDIKNDPNMLEILTYIAWVNINKIPSFSRSGNMVNEYKFWKNVIFKQIKYYEPRIIIFGGTFQHFHNDWEEYFNYKPMLKNKNGTKYFSNRLLKKQPPLASYLSLVN